MWQIMWVLEILPEWVWHMLLLLGVVAVVASVFLKMVPFISQYSLPIKLVGVAVVMLSLWMEGGFANESKWQARVAELEEKVRVAEAKSAEINTVIETVYVDRVQVVTDTKIIVQNNIRKSAKKMDQVCKIEPEVISILNESVKKPIKGDKK
jgi:hypothetical protein